MSVIHPVELGGVQKTLMLPLWGRAVETMKPHPRLTDPTALRIIRSIDYDFSVIASHISFMSQLSWIARSMQIDSLVGEFLKKHPAGTIVNLGCGLDTTFERVDNGKLVWYDLDLPDVVELRRAYIQPQPRQRLIAASILDDAWMRELQTSNPVMFIAAGVLYYFEEETIKCLMRGLMNHFPGSELIFDACSPLGVRISNKSILQATGMDSDARLQWGLKDAATLRRWDPRIAVLAQHPMYREIRNSLTFKERCAAFFADAMRMISIVHLRLGGESGSSS